MAASRTVCFCSRVDGDTLQRLRNLADLKMKNKNGASTDKVTIEH